MQKLNEDILSYLEWCTQKFLSYRPRSEFELTRYLREKIRKKRKEAEPQADDYIHTIVSKLKETSGINDKEFVEWWVKERTYFKPRGEKLLTMELRQKGISPELIRSYFDKNPVDESSLLQKIVQKKAFHRDLSIKKEYERFVQQLLRKGFAYGEIKKAIEELQERE